MNNVQQLEQLEERLRGVASEMMEGDVYAEDDPIRLCAQALDAITELRAERDAYVALYGKEKEWRSQAEMTAAELEAERKRHT